jgi:hypothetical protein
VFQDKKKMFKVISPMEKNNGTHFWMRCGVGYENKDNSINMYIEALPVNQKPGPLKLQLREYTEEEMRESRERAEQRRSSSGGMGGGGGGSYSSRGGSAGSGGMGGGSGSYSARGTLGSSMFDSSAGDPSHIPMIPAAGGSDAGVEQVPF